MTLEEFIASERNNHIRFEESWLRLNAQDPKSYPMDITAVNSGIWEEQFACFCGRK